MFISCISSKFLSLLRQLCFTILLPLEISLSLFPALTPVHTRTLSPCLSMWLHSFVTLWLSILYSISSLIFIFHTPLFLDLCLFLTIYSRKNFHYAAPTTMTTPSPPLPPSSPRWRTKTKCDDEMEKRTEVFAPLMRCNLFNCMPAKKMSNMHKYVKKDFRSQCYN